MFANLRCAVVMVLPFSVFFGCSQGPSALKSDRPSYNMAIQRTENEQMLLNLVRVKYREQVSFLTVSSVSAHFRYTISPDIFVRLNEGAGNIFGLGSDNSPYEVSEEPTITYTPLQGDEFASRIATEIDMETIALLFRSEWKIETLMRLTIQRIGPLHDLPTGKQNTGWTRASYDRFIELATLWQKLQDEGNLRFLTLYRKGIVVASGIPADKLSAASEILARKENHTLHRVDDGTFEIRKPARPVLVMEAAYSSEEVADKVDALLGIKPKRTRTPDGRVVERIAITRFGDPYTDDLGELGLGVVPVQVRSFLNVLYYVAAGIEVPESQVEKGVVKTYLDSEGHAVDRRALTKDMLNVKSSILRPRSAYVAVSYRGRWFYIDDTDIRSKDTFALIGLIFALHSGQIGSNQPLLTIPVGSK
ncbi:MAG: hypothetical protein GXP25_19360 [Planctomycetes bacterium]|nr:hypothetical protein [Planctomycetota bacterium]